MKPLEGTRILTIEQFAAGPYGTMLLAGMGAEVIRIENPAIGGDPARHTGPHLLGEGDSQYFQTWNVNKRSVVLDLKAPADREKFLELVKTADAVLNNLRGDQPAKLGLEYAQLAPLNPAIVCVHISAYGRDNPRASWPGYDYLMQAEAGLMSLTGEPSGPPARFGAPSPIDHMTGMTAATGLLGALLGARRTGKGCDVDVSLFDVALHLLGYAGTWAINAGGGAERQARSAHYSVAHVQTVPTADGWLYVMCMTQKFWEILAEKIGRPELVQDPRFAANPQRFANRAALTEILDSAFKTRTTKDWLAELSGAIPIAPVYDVNQALASPFVAGIGMIDDLPHPANPDLKIMGNPIRINGDRGAYAPCPPMGADNETYFGAAPAAKADFA